MDNETTNTISCGISSTSCGDAGQNVDTSVIFLNTLKAFDEEDRFANSENVDDIMPENEESFLPSLEYILAFSSYIREKIQFLLNMHGMTNDPPFEIDLNNRTGKLIITGDRKDVRKICKVIKGDKETFDGLVTLLSVADQTYQLLESLECEDDSFPEFIEGGKVVYLYGDGYLSLYKEQKV
ncbi:MAG: hypothetical protein C0603_13175 [Denitrovibrio sp.]|nr:MAG: hypothetical protein C0603_13175 [Denitrovibrio sp.]